VSLFDSLAPLWRAWCVFYLRRALVEIHPLHEDVPYIVRRLAELSR
jgi:hypothetical protein